MFLPWHEHRELLLSARGWTLFFMLIWGPAVFNNPMLVVLVWHIRQSEARYLFLFTLAKTHSIFCLLIQVQSRLIQSQSWAPSSNFNEHIQVQTLSTSAAKGLGTIAFTLYKRSEVPNIGLKGAKSWPNGGLQRSPAPAGHPCFRTYGCTGARLFNVSDILISADINICFQFF